VDGPSPQRAALGNKGCEQTIKNSNNLFFLAIEGGWNGDKIAGTGLRDARRPSQEWEMQRHFHPFHGTSPAG
jgi:hypothetical protein